MCLYNLIYIKKLINFLYNLLDKSLFLFIIKKINI
jgi:hypothetical protein